MAAEKSLIIYYSRSGTTRRVAQALAELLDCDIEPIVEAGNRSRAGVAGFVGSVIEALRQHTAPILPHRRDPAAYDVVVLASPVWAWSLSSPMRRYLLDHAARLPAVAFLCTMGGRGSDRAFAAMQQIVGKAPRATVAFTQADVVADRFRDRLTVFARTLRTGVGAVRPAA